MRLKKVKPGHIRITPVDNRFMATPPYANGGQNIPQWFRQIHKGHGSVRSCAGIMDYLSAGITVPAWTNFYFSPNVEAATWAVSADSTNPPVHDFEFAANFSYTQTGKCPMTEARKLEKMSYPKLITPWRIQTAPGWSSMLLPIPYDENEEFSVLPAIVHTDFYQVTNIVINPKTNTDFSIKWGTPLVKIVPFKRDSDITEIEFMDESFFKYASTNMYLTGAVSPRSGTGLAYRKAVKVVDTYLEKDKKWWRAKK